MKDYLTEWMMDSLGVLLMFTLVSVAWQVLELHMLGHINPNNVDVVIGMILGVSLWYNIKRVFIKEKQK